MNNTILKNIIQIPYGNYLKTKTKKTQIILHHTVSGGSAKAVADYWARLRTRIGTCIIIDKKGIPYQLYSSRYWAGHVGGHSSMDKEFNKFQIPYRSCSKSAIGVELIAWGGLIKKNNLFINTYNKEYNGIPDKLDKPYRGYSYFDPYTQEQLLTLKALLIYWNDIYNIPLNYNENMWDVNEDALSNRKGVWSHTSFRRDKSDSYPQKELIKMLKDLTNEETK